MPTVHIPVLLQEVIAGLGIKEGATVVDCTLGAGGHAFELGRHLGRTGTLIGLDADPGALERARQRLKELPCQSELFQGNFRHLAEYLLQAKVSSVDGILLDLGLSSDQLESSGRGFSFQKDEPLQMTFAQENRGGLEASEIVNEWQEDHLADVIWGYGGERYARRIARKIVEARLEGPIENTRQLVGLIEQALPIRARRGKIHPATKTFQALRIATNDELGALRAVLPQAWKALGPQGRLAIISFHSLEDRIVKNFLRERERAEEASLLSRKPIVPTPEECHLNPRSRSAKLRIAEKIYASSHNQS